MIAHASQVREGFTDYHFGLVLVLSSCDSGIEIERIGIRYD